jgi:DNA-binding NarL/FixJ family response regulator
MILPPSSRHDGAPVRVLLVEDHPILALALRELLASDERLILVDSVATGTEACRHGSLDVVDVALVDIGLPDVDGVEVMRSLLRRSPHLHVVIMSGSGHGGAAAEALADGAFAYVEKGRMHESLCDTLVAAAAHDVPVRR